MTTPLRAAIYARVSTKKEEQTTSIDSQLASCRLRCERDGWTVVGEFSDRLTGWKKGSMKARDGWQAVVRLMEARAIDVLLVSHRDRISRNSREFLDFRDTTLDGHGVRIIPLMGIEVDPQVIQTRWMEEDELTQAQRYSEMVSWKTREGRRRRLEAGFWPNALPYGTRRGAVKGIPEPHPEEWLALELMYRLAAEGLTHGQIRKRLEAGGHPTRRGGGWTLSSLAYILGNPFYIGEYWQDGEIYPLKHQCRVERSVWVAGQGEQRTKGKRGRPRVGDYTYLLPRVVCSDYQVESPAKRRGEPLPLYAKYCIGRGGVQYPYYYRADRLRGSGGLEAAPVGDTPLTGENSLRTAISAPALDNIVLDELEALAANSDLLTLRLSHANDQHRATVRRDLTSTRGLTTRYRGKLSRMRRGLSEQITYGNQIAIEVATEEIQRLEGLLTSLAATERRLLHDQRALDNDGPDIARAEQRLNMVTILRNREDWEGLAELISKIVDHIDLAQDHPAMYLRPVIKILRKAPASEVYLLPAVQIRRLTLTAA